MEASSQIFNSLSKEDLNEILPIYFEEIESLLKQLNQAILEKDKEKLKNLLHASIGLTVNFGFKELNQILVSLQTVTLERDLSNGSISILMEKANHQNKIDLDHARKQLNIKF